MNYLRAEDIARHYGERVLFEHITLSVEQGQRIALVARNGTGKTSLLNLLAGKDLPDAGKVLLQKDCKMAYLEQEPVLQDGLNVWEYIFSSGDQLLEAVAAYEKALHEHQQHPDDAGSEHLQQCMEKMESLQAWDYEARVRQILQQLDITDVKQELHSMSGGQRKRLALARVLIQDPDFIIMDEPTNHLDVQMIEWLETYLVKQGITLLLVTHDRYFLDKVCNEIVELHNGQLYRYHGNYAWFIEKRAEREFREERELEKARNLLRRELEWMRRQPKARGTKSKSRISAFYELQDKSLPRAEDKNMELQVRMQRMGGKVLELHKVSKAYGSKPLLRDFSYLFKPGERVGIVGKNGSGKSTLLNIITGALQPDSGRVSVGDTIAFGYYSQQGLQLKEDKRVIEVVKDIAEYMEMGKGERISASQLLKRFLFEDKMQHTFVSKLSGGEKRRLYLLTILLKNPNFLILDEPTNDLDIQTLNVLEEFLELYQGCLLIVTHDRYFMDRLAEHLFIFEGNGVLRDFNGNYQDYLDEQEELKEAQKKAQQQETARQETKTSNGSTRKKLSYKEQRELENLDQEIAAAESRKEELQNLLNDGGSNHEQLSQWAAELEKINEELDVKSMRWLELSELSS